LSREGQATIALIVRVNSRLTLLVAANPRERRTVQDLVSCLGENEEIADNA
jgi:hypothetical protein